MNDETLKEQIDEIRKYLKKELSGETYVKASDKDEEVFIEYKPTKKALDRTMGMIERFILQDRERAVRDSISKRKLRDELSEASEEMLKPILNDELDPSERWEWYGYIRATRDIAEFAGVLNDSPIQARLKKALAQLSNPTQTKKTK